MVILDTDQLTILAWPNRPVAERLNARLDGLPEGSVATTIVSYEEQMRGWLSVLAKAKTMADEISAYRRLVMHAEFFKKMTILPFDEPAAVAYQRLRSVKIRVGSMDLKIAAIAISRGATLLSRNLRDFMQIPDLVVEDWSE